MKLNTTDIINPIHPNRSTALFGGESSGILNWNDLRYPELYKKREQLRATFWSMSDIDWETVESQPVPYKQTYSNLLQSNIARMESIQRIADVTSDAAVTSVLATMIDQLNEHNLVLRKLANVSESHRVRKKQPNTLDQLLNNMESLVEEYDSIRLPAPATAEVGKIHDLLSTDYKLHVDFIKMIYNLTVREHNVQRNLYRVEETVTESATEWGDDL